MKRIKNNRTVFIMMASVLFAAMVSLTGCGRNNAAESAVKTSGVSEASETSKSSETSEDTAKNEQTEAEKVTASAAGTTAEPFATSAGNNGDNAEETQTDETRREKIQKLIDSMTLEEKVGGILFIRCPGAETGSSVVESYQPAGMILFGSDFENETEESLAFTINEYKEASKYGLLLGVDEEGGSVNRISRYSQFRDSAFKSPQELYKEGGFDEIEKDTTEKAYFLINLGLNVNLAPVCDVSTGENDFIYSRAFGQPAKETAEYVKTVVSAMNSAGIGSVLKHFPGYGNNVDTHTGIAEDDRDYDTFKNEDFLPFEAGIEAGADAVLVCHNIVNCMDPGVPASLSKNVHDILRNELGFTGVIMTDDLSMSAISEYADNGTAAVDAIKAGNDLLIVSDYESAYNAIYKAVNEGGEITQEMLDESLMRIFLWKLKLGIDIGIN